MTCLASVLAQNAMNTVIDSLVSLMLFDMGNFVALPVRIIYYKCYFSNKYKVIHLSHVSLKV